MTRTARTVAATLVAAVVLPLTATAAHADRSPRLTWSQAETRHDARIPASVKYVKGSAVVVSPGVRCFTGDATKRVRIAGVLVRRHDTIGYCGDGYTDVMRPTGFGLVIIHPAR